MIPTWFGSEKQFGGKKSWKCGSGFRVARLLQVAAEKLELEIFRGENGRESESETGGESDSEKKPLRNHENDTPGMKLPVESEVVSIFFSIFPPSISCDKYIARILRHTNISEGVYVHALVLLLRMEAKDSRLCLTQYNVHRLLICAVMISIKFLEHAWYSNKFYAQVGGVPSVSEINRMEITMLTVLDYEVFVKQEEIEAFRNQQHMGLYHVLGECLRNKEQWFDDESEMSGN